MQVDLFLLLRLLLLVVLFYRLSHHYWFWFPGHGCVFYYVVLVGPGFQDIVVVVVFGTTCS